ncbi:M3 family metallopeptidase [Pseudomonas arsenicoxydans]|uniref:Oligopeptidase A n=1 Tax=Pseudomonas arsenicoxydans TaxID=702115 RepID=A0A502I4R5_9PSED|nr:M3 family metallopeptidase [Pseudomonas arsenicoxydans]TPG81917.1 oligopeptidase A [Pseudomonas arsenicoxydans]
MPDTNPLLEYWDLPPWSAIRAEHLVPAIETIIADNRRSIAEITVSQSALPTWDDLVLAIDDLDARLDEAMGIIETLMSVKHDDDTWDVASLWCGEAMAHYKTEKMGHRALWQAYRDLAQSPAAQNYDDARKAVLSKILREFHLSGIELSVEQHQKLTQLNVEIGLLERLFLSNLQSASTAWSKQIDDVTQLKGLTQATQDRLALNARQARQSGWLIHLDQGTYHGVMTYAENRALREEYFVAYSTRASDQGPDAGQFDNEPVLERLLSLRHQKARLLGYENFAHLNLATEMAESTTQVSAFLRRQVTQVIPALAQDTQALKAFALECGISEVRAWDDEFLAEQFRQQNLGGGLKNLRAYFPLDGTLRRLCLFCERMFAIQIVEQTTFSYWHDSVRLFEVSEHGQVIGYIYLDPFHREEAADYAWTATRRNRRINAEGRLTRPIAVLHGNFTPGVNNHPCLLAHQDLRVLFHEFGHCLQHVLTRSPHHSLSGISQLGRDSAEFAGQLFELWCLSGEFLLWLGAHYQTGERLSEERVDKALAAVQIQTSRQTATQLMGALLDFELHHCRGDGRSIQQVFEDVQREIPDLQLPSYSRFANGFDYMVTGYAASVYAYQWSGVLATKAFKRFQLDWVFNPQTGKAFREAFFSPGDSRSLLSAVKEFLGGSGTDDVFAVLPEAIAR